MENLLQILNNYSKDSHLKELYSEITPINFKIEPLYSSNWSDKTWLLTNDIPYVALTNLMDSYYCLPERPDMAFTHIWKSINNSYLKLGKRKRIATGDVGKLNDSHGIEYLVNAIASVMGNNIEPTITIGDLIHNYIDIIPIKTLKFVSNFVLKGYAIKKVGLNPILNSSSHNSFASKHATIYNAIVNTYGQSYANITSPSVSDVKADLNIVNKQKSKSIPESLSVKLQELMRTGNTIITNSSSTTTYTLSFANHEEFIDVIIRVILYSIRNNSIHGNLVSRLNSEFVNQDSLKNSIYIFFLAHFILSLSLYVNGDVNLQELEVNIRNLNLLKTLI